MGGSGALYLLIAGKVADRHKRGVMKWSTVQVRILAEWSQKAPCMQAIPR